MTKISSQVNTSKVNFLLLHFGAQGLRESAPADAVSTYHLKLSPILSHYFSYPPLKSSQTSHYYSKH